MTEMQAWLPPRWLEPVAAQELPDGSRQYAGCSYAIETGFRPMQLDLRVPRADGPVPVVVWVHGGGYAMGDRRQLPDPTRFLGMFDSIVQAGMAVASIDYRLGREAVFPAAIHDAKAALRWLVHYADVLGIDADRVGLWGESAGGHLAGFVTATNGLSDFEGSVGVHEVAAQIRALVIWYGATDLTTIVRPELPPGVEAALGGNVPDIVRFPPEYFNLGTELWRDREHRWMASPLAHVTRAMPSTLLQHGDADRLVPIQQSEILAHRLSELGVHVEFDRIPGAGHGWQGIDQSTLDSVIARSVSFLYAHL